MATGQRVFDGEIDINRTSPFFKERYCINEKEGRRPSRKRGSKKIAYITIFSGSRGQAAGRRYRVKGRKWIYAISLFQREEFLSLMPLVNAYYSPSARHAVTPPSSDFTDLNPALSNNFNANILLPPEVQYVTTG